MLSCLSALSLLFLFVVVVVFPLFAFSCRLINLVLFFFGFESVMYLNLSLPYLYLPSLSLPPPKKKSAAAFFFLTASPHGLFSPSYSWYIFFLVRPSFYAAARFTPNVFFLLLRTIYIYIVRLLLLLFCRLLLSFCCSCSPFPAYCWGRSDFKRQGRQMRVAVNCACIFTCDYFADSLTFFLRFFLFVVYGQITRWELNYTFFFVCLCVVSSFLCVCIYIAMYVSPSFHGKAYAWVFLLSGSSRKDMPLNCAAFFFLLFFSFSTVSVFVSL